MITIQKIKVYTRPLWYSPVTVPSPLPIFEIIFLDLNYFHSHVLEELIVNYNKVIQFKTKRTVNKVGSW